ncbi:hypothetical protein CBER1_07352 [Cercospora berteroae]|uniref:Acyl-CoA thioesterase-like C-terminal domain-containing protein n=1 Tax=Cercospora berteroae TaxID=357750 RepID=A0A2S6CL28_9PEZI|nr:hypothetical protein CBER1_07352 [Cercospora berteroae]
MSSSAAKPLSSTSHSLKMGVKKLLETGLSFHTNWQAHPQRLPLTSSLTSLETGQDPAWSELTTWPNHNFRKATNQIRSFFPRFGQPAQNIYDQWVCLRDPTETWANEKLGYLVDMFPQLCETYILDGFDQYDPKLTESESGLQLRDSKRKFTPYWYPTVLLNLDVKKALPEGGRKFLFSRLQAKQIRNGRYDLEVVVWDEEDEIVALSHHVCFVVGAERNLAKRTTGGNSKI